MLIVIISVGKSRVSRIGCSVKVSSLDMEVALLRDHSLGSHSWLLRRLVGKPLGWPEWREARSTLGVDNEWWEGLRRGLDRLRPGINRHQHRKRLDLRGGGGKGWRWTLMNRVEVRFQKERKC